MAFNKIDVDYINSTELSNFVEQTATSSGLNYVTNPNAEVVSADWQEYRQALRDFPAGVTASGAIDNYSGAWPITPA